MNSKKLMSVLLAAVISLVPLGLTQTQIVKADTSTIGVIYRGHVQNVGWQNWVSDGAEAGTDGRSLRVEALNVKLTGNLPTGASIMYQAHVQHIGWQMPVESGQEAGTDAKGLRVEAIKIALVNMPGYSVQYRAHVQNVGWQNWVSDGAEAGTDGRSLRVEAMEIRIVKTADGSTPTPAAFVDNAGNKLPFPYGVQGYSAQENNVDIVANIDSPSDGQVVKSSTLNVSGWALAPYGVGAVDIWFDNGPGPNTSDDFTNTTINRPDVLKAFPEYNQLVSGFSKSVKLPQRLGNGRHTITIGVSDDGTTGYSTFTKTFNLQR